MHIWYLRNWENLINLTADGYRCGLRMRFDAGVNENVREFCKKFAKWLRKEFFFPIRVSVYIKKDYRIKAKDGEYVVGTFLWPAEYGTEPYVRIATGDYQDLKEKRGEEEAMWAILGSIAHELTHYFQYVNGISLTKIGEERQATTYSDFILSDYDEYLQNGECIKRKKDIWRSYKWKKNIDLIRENHRTGLRLRVDKDIDEEVRMSCKEFIGFLRKEYFFPIRIIVYIKSVPKIADMDGENVIGAFCFIEDDYTVEPHIRIETREYRVLCAKIGKNNILTAILVTIARELTYYFQWINGLQLTPIGKERQATRYARHILDDYAKTSRHI